MENADSGKPPPLFDRSGSLGEGSWDAEEGLATGDDSVDRDCEMAVAALIGRRDVRPEAEELSAEADLTGGLKDGLADERCATGNSSSLRYASVISEISDVSSYSFVSIRPSVIVGSSRRSKGFVLTF